MGFRSWVASRFGSPSAVYGTILYSALIAVVSTDHTDALEVLVVSVFSLIVLWGAHVYAETVAGHGVKDGTVIRLRTSFREGIAKSSGMLYAAIAPSLLLVLGVFHILRTDDAVSFSLLVATAVLGVLGFIAFTQRRSPIIIRILGALGTAFFGTIMILLNMAVH
jgi:hypothetical protein